MKKLYSIIILAFISFLNAVYLTIEAFRLKAWVTSEFICDINAQLSCSWLFTFDFPRIFGVIPFPLIAMFVYPIIATVAFLWVKWKCKKPFLPLLIIAILWMLFNSYFIFNEYLVWVYCPACLACSVAITTIAIISAFWIVKK